MTPKTRKRRAAKQRKRNEQTRIKQLTTELKQATERALYVHLKNAGEIQRLEKENENLKSRFKREGGQIVVSVYPDRAYPGERWVSSMMLDLTWIGRTTRRDCAFDGSVALMVDKVIRPAEKNLEELLTDVIVGRR